jgi:hypothetical protein
MKAISLGIAIDSMSLRALEAVHGEVRWLFEAQRTPDQPVSEALTEFIGAWSAQRRKWARPVAIALSGEFVQMKRLTGLPATTDAVLLANVVQESIPRYFVTAGGALRVGGVRIIGDGDVWVSAYDADLIDAVRRACASAGLSVQVVVPSLAVLGSAFAGELLNWRDGRRDLVVRFDAERRVEEIRRTPHLPLGAHAAPEQSDGRLTPAAGLAIAGPEAWRFADAYGAVVAGMAEPTRYVVTLSERDADRSPWRLAAAAGALGVALIAAAVAPGAIATHEATHASRALRRLDPQRSAIAASQWRLHQATRALEDLNRFDQGRRPVLPLLAAITRRLPEGSAIVALSVDTLGGTLVVVAPRAAAVVTALDPTPGIASPEIVGPVTRETISGVLMTGVPAGTPPELERVTIQFRRPVPQRESSR